MMISHGSVVHCAQPGAWRGASRDASDGGGRSGHPDGPRQRWQVVQRARGAVRGAAAQHGVWAPAGSKCSQRSKRKLQVYLTALLRQSQVPCVHSLAHEQVTGPDSRSRGCTEPQPRRGGSWPSLETSYHQDSGKSRPWAHSTGIVPGNVALRQATAPRSLSSSSLEEGSWQCRFRGWGGGTLL